MGIYMGADADTASTARHTDLGRGWEPSVSSSAQRRVDPVQTDATVSSSVQRRVDPGQTDALSYGRYGPALRNLIDNNAACAREAAVSTSRHIDCTSASP